VDYNLIKNRLNYIRVVFKFEFVIDLFICFDPLLFNPPSTSLIIIIYFFIANIIFKHHNNTMNHNINIIIKSRILLINFVKSLTIIFGVLQSNPTNYAYGTCILSTDSYPVFRVTQPCKQLTIKFYNLYHLPIKLIFLLRVNLSYHLAKKFLLRFLKILNFQYLSHFGMLVT